MQNYFPLPPCLASGISRFASFCFVFFFFGTFFSPPPPPAAAAAAPSPPLDKNRRSNFSACSARRFCALRMIMYFSGMFLARASTAWALAALSRLTTTSSGSARLWQRWWWWWWRFQCCVHMVASASDHKKRARVEEPALRIWSATCCCTCNSNDGTGLFVLCVSERVALRLFCEPFIDVRALRVQIQRRSHVTDAPEQAQPAAGRTRCQNPVR